MSLHETLFEYSKTDMYPFHMPGHKRALDGVYKIDMTEVEGVDDLHDPEGVIAAEQERLSKVYEVDKSFILVGGSTVGNLAAIYASLDEGDLILIPRNAHKSIYNGIILRHLRVGYIYPKIDEGGIYSAVTVEEIENAIDKEGKPKAVVVISPTYEGFVSNIKDIADYCHSKDIALIVDAAHGAHLGFHSAFPLQPAKYADVTVVGLHKTLPALTQSAALHLQGPRISASKIKAALDIFETSSPSYVLMESISKCIDVLENSTNIFEDYVENLKDFYSISGQLKYLELITDDIDKKDMGKLVISTRKTNITGVELAKILRNRYKLETEMSSFSYVLAMTSIMDTKEGFERLKKALIEIDEELGEGQIAVPYVNLKPIKRIEPWQAKAGKMQDMMFYTATGRTSCDMVCLYPPATPVIVPGEEITEDAIKVIHQAKEAGIHVTGIKEGHLSVVN